MASSSVPHCRALLALGLWWLAATAQLGPLSSSPPPSASSLQQKEQTLHPLHFQTAFLEVTFRKASTPL